MARLPFASDQIADRHWRSSVLWTAHDLRLSLERRRKLSLSNLCRLFEYRWRKRAFDERLIKAGIEAGRTFLGSIYPKFTIRPMNADGNGG